MSKIIAIDPEKKYNYIPECERDLESADQTIFHLSMPKAKEAANLQDNITESTLGDQAVMRVKSGSSVLSALQVGLRGWENFKDAKGQPILWRDNNGKPRPEMFDVIPPKIRQELAEVITSGIGLDEEQEKN